MEICDHERFCRLDSMTAAGDPSSGAIEGQTHAMVCVNDPEGDVDFETLARKLRQSFEKILPGKSMFEK